MSEKKLKPGVRLTLINGRTRIFSGYFVWRFKHEPGRISAGGGLLTGGVVTAIQAQPSTARWIDLHKAPEGELESWESPYQFGPWMNGESGGIFWQGYITSIEILE